MDQNQKQLLRLVSIALFDLITDVRLDKNIIKEAKLQAVHGLVDPEAYPVFANNVRVTKAHAELCSLLEGVPFTTIKGCASASYYPHPVRRSMGDVDFYVEEKDFAKAEERLLQAGFEFDHETAKHRCFRKSGICYEMHSVINGAPADNTEIQRMFEDLIRTSRIVSFKNESIRIPDDFHNGLICLLHICRHLSESEMGLRQFCDWACFVNHTGSFEELFKEKLEPVGLWTCARILSLTAVRYLGLPYQSWMGEADEKTTDLLIEEIMASGNMGRKRSEYETEWFVDREGTGSTVKGVISSLNDVTGKNWPAARRCPVLYPFGWIFFAIRYLIRSVMGKRRKINIGKITSRAEKRNRLLKSLQLFRT